MTRARGEGRLFQRKASSFWWCAYYLRGREYRESTGETDQEKARKFLKRRIKEVGADQIGARPFVTPQQERLKVGELLDALQNDYELRGKISPQFFSHMKPVRAYFAECRAVDVTAEDVDRFIRDRRESEDAPATINRRTQLLAQAFKLAIKRRSLSTAPNVRHLSESGNERQGFFSDVEFHSVLEKLPDYLRDFTLFGYLVGWRKSEVASLRWEDVEGDVIRLRGVHSKNEDGRPLTLTGELADLIERRRADRQVKTDQGVAIAALIFHNSGRQVGDFRKAWHTASVEAGIGQFICPTCDKAVNGHRCAECKVDARYSGRLFHDFRRTAVRNMIRAGVPEKVAMSVSGHKTRSVFDRYNIVNEEDLRNAMSRTQSYLKAQAQKQKLPTPMKAARSKS